MTCASLLVAAALVAAPTHAQDLDQKSRDLLGKIKRSLDSTETQLAKKKPDLVRKYFLEALKYWEELDKGLSAEQKALEAVVKTKNRLDDLRDKAQKAGVNLGPELPARVKTGLSAIRRLVDEALKALEKKDLDATQEALVSADETWGEAKDKDGKEFSSDHSEVVSVLKLLSAAKAKAKEAGIRVHEGEPIKRIPSNEKSLLGNFCGEIEFLRKKIEEAGKAREEVDSKVRWVKNAYVELKKKREQFLKDYSNRPEIAGHPRFKWAMEKFDDVAKYYDSVIPGLEGGVSAEKDKFQKLVEGLAAAIEPIQKARGALENAIAAALKAREKPDLDKVRSTLPDVFEQLNRAAGVIELFQKEYPNPAETGKKFGLDVGDAILKISRIGSERKTVYSILETAAAEEAKHGLELNLKVAREAVERAEKGEHAKSNAEQAVTDAVSAQNMIFLIQVLCPLQTEEGQIKWELTDRMTGAAKRAGEAQTELDAVRVRAAKILKQEEDARKLRILNARFAKPTMTGGEWDKIETEIVALLNTEWKELKRTILRVGIYSDWTERALWARYGNNNVWEHFKFIQVNAAVDRGDCCWVYVLTFRRMKTSGGWGELQRWGVGGGFEILKENVHK